MVKKMILRFGNSQYCDKSSAASVLGFLSKDCSGQLLGVCDVGAPGHHSAHQFGREDVAQVDVNFLPGIAVAAACW